MSDGRSVHTELLQGLGFKKVTAKRLPTGPKILTVLEEHLQEDEPSESMPRGVLFEMFEKYLEQPVFFSVDGLVILTIVVDEFGGQWIAHRAIDLTEYKFLNALNMAKALFPAEQDL